MTRIIMRGCNGHMGRVIADLVKEDKDAEIVAGIDEDTGIREAVRILAGILFKARVPASFSSKMTARLVQSITYEKYFEEKLSTGFENIDLSEHISNLLKK